MNTQEKVTYIKNYYKGREDSERDVKIVDKGDKVIIEGYDGDEEIDKSKIKVLISGCFILDFYNVEFVDITNNYERIGLPLAIDIDGYNKARAYGKKGMKAIGITKFWDDWLLISHSLVDKKFII